MSRLLVEVGPDLAVAVGVVAERDHVDAGGEQLVGVLRRDADAAGGVLAVDDDEVERELLAQAREQLAERAAAGASRRRRRRRGSRSRADGSGQRAAGRILGACERARDRRRRRGASRPSRSRRRPVRRAAGAEPPAASRRWWCRAGSSSSCCRWRCSAPWRCSRAPPGRCCCCSSSPALIALLLNPFVTLLRRARFPRGLAVLTVYLALLARRRRHRRPARQPGRRPGLGVPRQRAGDRRRRERRRSPTCRRWLDDNGIDVAGRRAGPDGARDARRPRRARARASSSRSRATRCRRLVEALDRADPDRRPVASTCCSTASGSAPRCARVVPRGDGTPEDDFPTRIQARGVRLRARPAAVLADHGHERGRRAVDPRLARDLPRRQDLRARSSARSTASPS